jgi:hypothetical protein
MPQGEMMDKPKRDEEGKIPRITKTCKVVLAASDGTRYPVGDFTIEEKEPGPTMDQFADTAFKAARASLARLMTPQYRLVVIDGAVEQGYGLDRWIKLVDGTKQLDEDAPSARKQRVRRGKLAA